MNKNEILNYFSSYIFMELGIVFSDSNQFQLLNRLEELTKKLNLKCIEDLYKEAKNGIHGEMKALLIDLVTNNETSFFRDPKLFSAIEKRIITDYVNKNIKSISFWSAASSSGQEALSIAMLMNELNSKLQTHIDFQIYGSDISQRILDKAKSGTYSELEIQRGLDKKLLEKYFHKNEKGNWTANTSLLSKIKYERLNLKNPFPRNLKFDIVFCRNVLIYQDVSGKTEILNKISDCLDTGGILVLGSGESLMGISSDYEMISIEGAILYKRKERLLSKLIA